MGDEDAAHDNMVVKANGKVMVGDVDTAAGAYAVNTFIVTVGSGILNIQFLDPGGMDSIWVVNAISVAASSRPPSACDRAQFIADVTVPDGTVYAPGAGFLKTWRLKNVGTCTWSTFYAMVFESGNKLVVEARQSELLAQYTIPAFELECEPADRPAFQAWANGLTAQAWVSSVVLKDDDARVVVKDIAAAQVELLAQAAQSRIRLRRYEVVTPSLEDIFLRLVGNGASGRAG